MRDPPLNLPWCEREDLRDLADIEPIHIAAYVETLQVRLAAPR